MEDVVSTNILVAELFCMNNFFIKEVNQAKLLSNLIQIYERNINNRDYRGSDLIRLALKTLI